MKTFSLPLSWQAVAAVEPAAEASSQEAAPYQEPVAMRAHLGQQAEEARVASQATVREGALAAESLP